MEDLLTTKQVAKYLRLNPVTVRRKVARGEIPAVKMGRQIRFNRAQIDAWLVQNNTGMRAQILVIDDEPVIGQLFKDSLNNNGYQVTTTLSSLEALELVGNRHFDLIFLDLLMPVINGAELFRRIRQMDNHIPVAIITGYPDSDLMGRAMEYGPFTIMKKPFNSDDILNTVRTFAKGVKTGA
jgi:excisionase family DNA binding protein